MWLVLFSSNKVKELDNANKRLEAGGVTERPLNAPEERSPFAAKTPWQTLFAVPLAIAIALGIHWFAAKKEPPNETRLYSYFFSV
jgi:hypothetical protein